MNVFLAILGLALLVVIHEGGHFLTALAVGMRPRSFNVGFGPPLAKTTRNGVLYALRAIPLGGYVKIPGMHRPASQDLDVAFGPALHEAPELVGPVDRARRSLVGDNLEDARTQVAALREATLAADLTPAALRVALRGLQEVSDGLSGEAYWRQRTWKRIAVILAGPFTNLVLAVVLFAILFMTGALKATRVVKEVLPNHPAAVAGLRPGDRIEAINGRAVEPEDIPSRIQASRGKPITLTIERANTRLVIGPVQPRREEGVYRLGFRLRGESLSAPDAASQSVQLTWTVTKGIAKTLVRIFNKKDREQLSGTVGIVQGSSQALEQGVRAYLGVLGLVSLSLALFNLLPLLPLDGGHIAFSLIEAVRRRPVGRAIYERVSAVGIALVLLLFVVGLTNDVGRLGGG